MPPDASAEDVARAAVARHVAAPGRVAPLHGGLSNRTFAVETAERGAVVVRLGDEPDKLSRFERERRAVAMARGAGVPTQEIVAVGQEEGWAFSIARRLPGHSAVESPDQSRLLEELGRIARLVHTVRTTGYGGEFGSDGGAPLAAQTGGATTWAAFLRDEIDAEGRLARLAALGMISEGQRRQLEETLGAVAAWTGPPVLNHGDLRLKNVVVDGDGRTLAVIDWEWSISSIGPHWDLSVALHDLAIDAKQAFLAGYAMPEEEVRQAAPAWRLFNVLNYAPKVDALVAAGESAQLEQIRTRLSGALDLYA